MAGCPRSLILDRADTDPLKDVRHAIEREGSGATTLTPAFLERIVRKLGGDSGRRVRAGPRSARSRRRPGPPHRPAIRAVARNPFPSPRPLYRRRRQRQDLARPGEGKASLQGRQAGGTLLLQQRAEPVPSAAGLRLAAGQAGLYRGVPRVRPRAGCPGRNRDRTTSKRRCPASSRSWRAAWNSTSGWTPSSSMKRKTSRHCGGSRCWPAPLTLRPARCMRLWTTDRTSIKGGQGPAPTASIRRRIWCPSISMKTSATPGRSPRHSGPSQASTSRPAAAPGCLYGASNAPRRRPSTPPKNASKR